MAEFDGIHHVKLPVADVARSRLWYERVLGMGVTQEFVEDGVVMGVAIEDPLGTVPLALRHDPDRAGALAGFDPIAIGVATVEELDAWRHRLDRLGEAHGGVVTGSRGGAVLVGLSDPDGMEIRLYADPT